MHVFSGYVFYLQVIVKVIGDSLTFLLCAYSATTDAMADICPIE